MDAGPSSRSTPAGPLTLSKPSQGSCHLGYCMHGGHILREGGRPSSIPRSCATSVMACAAAQAAAQTARSSATLRRQACLAAKSGFMAAVSNRPFSCPFPFF